MNPLRVREDFNSNTEYEDYRRDLFFNQILSFVTQLQSVTLLNYNKLITQGIHSTDIVEIEQIMLFQRITVCNDHIKQAWLKKVSREIMSSFGSDIFLSQDLMRELPLLAQIGSLLVDEAYVAYLIEKFGVEHDLSDADAAYIAYTKAILSQDKEAQKVWGKKVVQQLVKEAQNDVALRKPEKAAECS